MKVPINQFTEKLTKALLFRAICDNIISKPVVINDQQYIDFTNNTLEAIQGLKNNLSYKIYKDSSRYYQAVTAAKNFDQIRDLGEEVAANATLNTRISNNPKSKDSMTAEEAKLIVETIDTECNNIYYDFLALHFLAENFDIYLKHTEDAGYRSPINPGQLEMFLQRLSLDDEYKLPSEKIFSEQFCDLNDANDTNSVSSVAGAFNAINIDQTNSSGFKEEFLTNEELDDRDVLGVTTEEYLSVYYG